MVKNEFIILTRNCSSVGIVKRIFKKDNFKSYTLMVMEGVFEKMVEDYSISFDNIRELNNKFDSVVNEYKNRGYK